MPGSAHASTGRSGTRIAAALLCPLLATACQTVAPRCDIHAETIPVTIADGAVLVFPALDGHRAPFMLDTGSTRSIITSDAATRLGLDREHLADDSEVMIGYALEGVGGRRHIDRVWPHAITLAGNTRIGVPLALVQSRNTAWHSPGDGVLGMDWFDGYDVDLDLAANRITLTPSHAGCAPALHASAAHAIPLAQAGLDSRPLVHVTLNGYKLLALIDTGAEHSTLFATAAARAGLAWPLHAAYRVGGIGPATERAANIRVAHMTIGDLTLRNVDLDLVGLPDAGGVDLLLGLDFLRRAHVTISRSTRLLAIDTPTTAPETTEASTPALLRVAS